MLAGVVPVKYPQYALLSDLIFWAATLFLVSIVAWWIWFNRHALKAGAKRLTGLQWLLLVGLGGLWLFGSMAVAAGAWMVWNGSSSTTVGAASIAPAAEDGPLRWFGNLEMFGGSAAGLNVHQLSFHGLNASQREVRLISAAIRSAIDGSEITLKVQAPDQLVAIDQINLVPSGAPIKLTAVMPKQGGFTADEFLASWSRFNFIARDDEREYRIPFNEAAIAPFFPGRVGPRVTKKQ
ncbi:hypothetical protein [Bradyrhizobium nanningense]|uniref:hypothetical protein n=1 Tax=Bradyrhizobium nanningense TaxID=1325118 RepID=UPI00100869D9|nr:hypothetical protein [Bradyrhizobium nanningense]